MAGEENHIKRKLIHDKILLKPCWPTQDRILSKVVTDNRHRQVADGLSGKASRISGIRKEKPDPAQPYILLTLGLQQRIL